MELIKIGKRSRIFQESRAGKAKDHVEVFQARSEGLIAIIVG